MRDSRSQRNYLTRSHSVTNILADVNVENNVVDRDHLDHISRLTDDELAKLHKSLSDMQVIAENMSKIAKPGESIEVEGLYGTRLQVAGGQIGWKPDLSPVEKALNRVHEEMLERELLRE